MPDNHSIMRAETSLAVLLSPPLRLLERRHRPLRPGPRGGVPGTDLAGSLGRSRPNGALRRPSGRRAVHIGEHVKTHQRHPYQSSARVAAPRPSSRLAPSACSHHPPGQRTQKGNDMNTSFEQTIERLAIDAEIRDLAARFSDAVNRRDPGAPGGQLHRGRSGGDPGRERRRTDPGPVLRLQQGPGRGCRPRGRQPAGLVRQRHRGHHLRDRPGGRRADHGQHHPRCRPPAATSSVRSTI